MDKIICPRCTPTGIIGEAVWIPLHNFVTDWHDNTPVAIIAYYKCTVCNSLFSTSIPVRKEWRNNDS